MTLKIVKKDFFYRMTVLSQLYFFIKILSPLKESFMLKWNKV